MPTTDVQDYGIVTGDVILKQKGYAVVDLMAGIKVVDRVRVTVNVRNVGNREVSREPDVGRRHYYAAPRSATRHTQLRLLTAMERVGADCTPDGAGSAGWRYRANVAARTIAAPSAPMRRGAVRRWRPARTLPMDRVGATIVATCSRSSSGRR